jgi:hypothetical protein
MALKAEEKKAQQQLLQVRGGRQEEEEEVRGGDGAQSRGEEGPAAAAAGEEEWFYSPFGGKRTLEVRGRGRKAGGGSLSPLSQVLHPSLVLPLSGPQPTSGGSGAQAALV